MSWYRDADFSQLTNVKVKHVSVVDGSIANLLLDDGRVAKIELHGDCCSDSYFADPSQLFELKDSTILEVELREGASSDKLETKNEEDYEVWKWHFLVFKTSAGHVTVDWRNESNGYYDGWPTLEFPASA